MHTCVDKYFVFYIDPMDSENVLEMSRLANGRRLTGSPKSSDAGYKQFRAKNEFNHFRLTDLGTNEQFKSTLTLRCFKFIPINVDLSDK